MVKNHLPCPCGDSSDGYSLFDDGHGYCFACQKDIQPVKTIEPAQPDPKTPKAAQEWTPFKWRDDLVGRYRGINEETLKFFGVSRRVREDGKTEIIYPYQYGELVRLDEDKRFWGRGDMSTGQLFGMNLFPPGSAKSITIHEGANDAMSGWQMFGSKYPNVSGRSAGQLFEDCQVNFKYLNSFEQIYLAFDNDDPGQEAVRQVRKLFDFNKIFLVQYSEGRKDANDYLRALDEETYRRVWFNSRRIVPASLISSWDDTSEIIRKDKPSKGFPYPFPKLTEMTYGLKPQELVLVTAQEGIGKTEFIRAIEEKFLLDAPEEDRIAIIHLEEDKAWSIKALAGLQLGCRINQPECPVTDDEIDNAYRRLTKKSDRLWIHDHFGSIDDPKELFEIIQFLVGPCGCKVVVLDHLSIVVSGSIMDDERKTLDWLSTRLKMLTKSHKSTFVVVSHVNDEGLPRGSRNIAKVCDTHIQLRRDINSPVPEIRSLLKTYVVKNRPAAMTGPADEIRYDFDTTRLSAVEVPF